MQSEEGVIVTEKGVGFNLRTCHQNQSGLYPRSNLTAWSARQAAGGWIKVVKIKKKDSSTRSSVRKSGKLAEMLKTEKVGMKRVF